ncbi:putative isopropanol dehydrogenase [Xylariaceae sp. FL0662B]|nr:putative isopropanol dehydrogenase [Xylariaceae sp. FL0662B]
MAISMKALVLHGPGDLRLEEVPKPAASPGSIVSEVISGVLKFPHSYPLIFGTCCVGRIEEVGSDVTSLETGQLVFCDHIIYLRDAPEKRFVLGYHGGHSPQELSLSSGHWRDGCFAEYARFPTENVHAVDETAIAQHGVIPVQLGELSTVMSAIGAANCINIRAGETVLVMPATGFFSSGAIVATLALGANVVAVSRSKDTLDAMIEHFGNEGKRIAPVVPTGNAAEDSAALRAATPEGKGADAYIDFSSPEATEATHIQAGLGAMKRKGRNGATKCATIRLVEAGNLKLRKTVAGEFGLNQLDQAIKLAKESRGWEKLVLIMP